MASKHNSMVPRGKTLKLGHVWVQKLGAIGRFKERFCVLTTNNQLEYYQKQEDYHVHKVKGVIPALDTCVIDVLAIDKKQSHSWTVCSAGGLSLQGSGEPVAEYRFLLATETEQEKTNWVLEILKLRQVEAIIALLDHATLHTYAAHALSNIASGRDDVKKEEIVQSAGHLRMLRFLKDCPDDAKLHSTIIYALSQVALLEANKEEIGCSCFKKLYKLFTKSPNESVREYALQTIAHLATTPHNQDRLWLSGMGDSLSQLVGAKDSVQSSANATLKFKGYALLALGNTAAREVYAWRVSKLMEHIPELLYREGEEGASSTSFERDAAECALIALLNCASHASVYQDEVRDKTAQLLHHLGSDWMLKSDYKRIRHLSLRLAAIFAREEQNRKAVAQAGGLGMALEIIQGGESEDLAKLREDSALDSALALVNHFAQDERFIDTVDTTVNIATLLRCVASCAPDLYAPAANVLRQLYFRRPGEAKQSQTAFLDLFWSLWPRSAKQSFTFGNIVALEHGSQGSVAFKLAPIAKPLRGKIICDVLQVVEISTRCSVGLKAMCYPTTNQQPTGSHSTAQTTDKAELQQQASSPASPGSRGGRPDGASCWLERLVDCVKAWSESDAKEEIRDKAQEIDALHQLSKLKASLDGPFGSPRSKRSPTLSSSPKEASPRLTRVKKEKASTWSSAVPTSPRGQGPLTSPRGQSPSPTASPRPRGQSKRVSRDRKEKKKKAKGEKKEAEESDDVITLLITTLSNCSAHGAARTVLGSAKAVSVMIACMPSLGDRKKAFIASTRLLANCMRLESCRGEVLANSHHLKYLVALLRDVNASVRARAHIARAIASLPYSGAAVLAKHEVAEQLMKVATTEFLEEKKKLRKKEKKSHGSLVDHHAIWVQNLLLALRNFSASDLLFPQLSSFQVQPGGAPAEEPTSVAQPHHQQGDSIHSDGGSAAAPCRFLFHVLARALASLLTDTSRTHLLATIGHCLAREEEEGRAEAVGLREALGRSGAWDAVVSQFSAPTAGTVQIAALRVLALAAASISDKDRTLCAVEGVDQFLKSDNERVKEYAAQVLNFNFLKHKRASVTSSDVVGPPNVREMFAVIQVSQNPVVLEQLLEALHRLHLYTDRADDVALLRRAAVDHVAVLTSLLGDPHTKAIRFYASKLIISASVNDDAEVAIGNPASLLALASLFNNPGVTVRQPGEWSLRVHNATENRSRRKRRKEAQQQQGNEAVVAAKASEEKEETDGGAKQDEDKDESEGSRSSAGSRKNEKEKKKQKKIKSKNKEKEKEKENEAHCRQQHLLELYVRGPPGPTLAFEFAAEELFVEQSARAIAQGSYDQTLPEPLGSPTSMRGRDGAAQQGLDLPLGSAGGQGGKRGSIHKTRLMTLTQLNPRDVAGYLDHESQSPRSAGRSDAAASTLASSPSSEGGDSMSPRTLAARHPRLGLQGKRVSSRSLGNSSGGGNLRRSISERTSNEIRTMLVGRADDDPTAGSTPRGDSVEATSDGQSDGVSTTTSDKYAQAAAETSPASAKGKKKEKKEKDMEKEKEKEKKRKTRRLNVSRSVRSFDRINNEGTSSCEELMSRAKRVDDMKAAMKRNASASAAASAAGIHGKRVSPTTFRPLGHDDDGDDDDDVPVLPRERSGSASLIVGPVGKSLHNSLLDDMHKRSKKAAPKKELSHSDGSRTVETPAAAGSDGVGVESSKSKASSSEKKSMTATATMAAAEDVAGVEKVKKVKKGASVREKRSKKPMSARVLSADHGRTQQVKKEGENGDRKRTHSDSMLAPPTTKKEGSQQQRQDGDEGEEGEAKKDSLAGRIYGEKQLQAFVNYWGIVHPEFVPHGESLLSYLQENILVTGHDDDIELSGVKGDDDNGPSGWAQAKGAVAAASSLTIQADKQTVSYWPRVFGKVGSTISARPLASATTTTATTATGVADAGSAELSLGAKEAASSPVSHTSPWPYFEILIVNRGYYGSIAVGLGAKNHPATAKPGSVLGSYGWHGDGNKWAHGKSSLYPANAESFDEGDDGSELYFNTGDVIGCGFNDVTSEVFYTKNGLFLGVGHTEVSIQPSEPLYAVVSLAGPQEKVWANFGQAPFLWDFQYHQTSAPSLHHRLAQCASSMPGLAHLLARHRVPAHQQAQLSARQNSLDTPPSFFLKSAKLS